MYLEPLALQLSCLVVVAPLVRDVSDLSPGEGGGPGVTETFIDWKLNLPADVIVELGESRMTPGAPALFTPTRGG